MARERHSEFEPIVDRVDEYLLRYFSNAVVGLIVFWLFMSVSVAWHEAVGHVIVAKMLGCNGGVVALQQIWGMSSIDCSMYPVAQENAKLVLIALSGPIFSFLLGAWIWIKMHKDHHVRQLALVLFFFSCLPSLMPGLYGNDMTKAIGWGLDSGTGWIIFFVVASIIALMTQQEITEKKYPYV